jgi:L,D-transpeptidase YcbB
MRMRADSAGIFFAAVLTLSNAAAQAQTAPEASAAQPSISLQPSLSIIVPQQPEVVVDIERQLRAQRQQEDLAPGAGGPSLGLSAKAVSATEPSHALPRASDPAPTLPESLPKTAAAPVAEPGHALPRSSDPTAALAPPPSKTATAPGIEPGHALPGSPDPTPALAPPPSKTATAPGIEPGHALPGSSDPTPALAPPPSKTATAPGIEPSHALPISPAPPLPLAPPPGDRELTAEALKSAAETFADTEVPRQNASEQSLRKERDAIVSFYAERNYSPLWIVNGHWSAAAESVMTRIALAADDGLDLSDYAISSALEPAPPRLAEAELRLSEAVAAYGKQASGGRLDPARLSNLIGAKPDVADAGRVLRTVADAADAGAALRGFNPSHRAYVLLRNKLLDLRRNRKPLVANPIPAGPILRVGMRDPRVPLVRARFGLDLGPLSERPSDSTYDTKVAAAVADFQRANGLPPSGILTARTVSVLSGGESSRVEAEVLANMERWRWLPRQLGTDYVEVNIPDYMLQVVHSGSVVHEAKVVVGKPENPTPIFSHNMEFIIVNPYWNVPYSIIKKEMLPKLATDPDYFARHGYEVVQHGDTLIVRQPPGEENALGRIKFMFPNSYSVYLHDTPSRSLFADDRRAFSHGCVRVDQPFKLAEVVLGRDNGWSEDRVKRLVGRGERSINLPHPLPVHIVYFTAFVDEYGKLQLRDDIYGYSQRVRAALGLKG